MSFKPKKEEDYIISFNDFKALVFRNRTKIACWTVAIALLAALWTLTKPPQYVLESSFKEKGKTQVGWTKSLAETLLSGGAAIPESEAVSYMKSRKLTENVVRKLDLQGKVCRVEKRYPSLAAIRDNLTVEFAHLNKAQYPVLSDFCDAVAISQITYNEEVPLTLNLKFTTDASYSVSMPDGQEIEGQLDKLFQHGTIGFKLTRNGSDGLADQKFVIELRPVAAVGEEISKNLIIMADKTDKTLLVLRYPHRDRHQGSKILNGIMELYLEHLRQEHQRIAGEQLHYLEERRKEMGKELNQMMDDYAYHLSSDLSETGFPNTTKAMDFLAGQQNDYRQKLVSIDLEKKRLQKAQEEGFVYYDRYTSHGDPIIINEVLSEIRSLKQQADALDLALRSGGPAELKSVHERTLEERLKHLQAHQKEFLGIDLATAKELYLTFTKQLNDVQAEALQTQFVLNQMKNPDFEISSLSAILKDSVSKDMIAKASNLVLNLKDQNNRSQKELERLREELDLEKGFLETHVKQSKQLLGLHEHLIKEKMHKLQNATLGLVHQQISIYEKHLDEYITARLNNLKQERGLIHDNQLILQKEMAKLPTKWVSEKLIDQQMLMNQNMLEELSKMVESKNISSNLELVLSAPIDSAIPPILPKPPRLLLFLMLGAAIGCLSSITYFVIRTAIEGMPASRENLVLAQKHVSGTISKHSEGTDPSLYLDSDLETLRKAISYLDLRGQQAFTPVFGETLLLLKGKGPDYSHCLANLLRKKGSAVLLLSLSFDKPCPPDAFPGLLHYLKSEATEPKIINQNGVDCIETGGISRFSTEMVCSHLFNELLLKLKYRYQWIIAVSPAMPTTVEAQALIQFFDQAAVTLANERLPQLEPLIALAEKKITFLFAE